MANMQPGKGIHIDQSPAVADFLFAVTTDASAAMVGRSPDETLKWLITDRGWTPSADSFGEKAHKALALGVTGTQELRVTVVLKNGQLKLDIRTWFIPS